MFCSHIFPAYTILAIIQKYGSVNIFFALMPTYESQAVFRAYIQVEQWVNNTSQSSLNEKLAVVELEGRHARLGIGATVPSESKVALPNNPVERKLLAKLYANNRKVIDRTDESAPSAKIRNLDEECEEDESESKTKAFAKKRPMRLTSPFMTKRKHVKLAYFAR